MLLTSIGQHFTELYKKLYIEREKRKSLDWIRMFETLKHIASIFANCKHQKNSHDPKAHAHKIQNAIFRTNNKNRSVILNGWNLCVLSVLQYSCMRRWKRCKQQTDRKKIVQKEINAIFLHAKERWKQTETALEKHLVHFYWCLSGCSSSLFLCVCELGGIYDAHCALTSILYVRAYVRKRVYSLQWIRMKGEDEQINSVYTWHCPHFDLQSNLIVRPTVMRASSRLGMYLVG